MLQEHVKNYQKQVNELKDSQDELEQYGRRLCIRIDGVPMAENETSNDVLQNVKSFIEESSSEIQDVAIDRVHRIGKAYTDKTSGVKCKSIIVRFTTFRHRTMFYYSKKNLKRNVKVKLDLPKKCYSFLASLFDKVARLRACKFIAERLRRGYFPVSIAEFLGAAFFVEHLVAACELSVLQKLCFLNFDTLRFII